MFETISVANLLQKLKETQNEEVKSKAIKDFLPPAFMRIFDTIEESWNYGQNLCEEYLMAGELEKAIAVDKAFQDTKLDVPEENSHRKTEPILPCRLIKIMGEKHSIATFTHEEMYHRHAKNRTTITS